MQKVLAESITKATKIIYEEINSDFEGLMKSIKLELNNNNKFSAGGVFEFYKYFKYKIADQLNIDLKLMIRKQV